MTAVDRFAKHLQLDKHLQTRPGLSGGTTFDIWQARKGSKPWRFGIRVPPLRRHLSLRSGTFR